MYIVFALIFGLIGSIAIIFSLNAIRIGRIPNYFKPFFGGARKKDNAIKYWLQILIIFLIGILFFYLTAVSYLNA